MESIRRVLTRANVAYAVAVAAALLSLALRAALPISAEGYLLHDDALFLRLAQNIANGDWLGPFDNLTLAKGAFYPLFMALAHLIGLPLPLAEQLVYLAAAAAVALVLARAAGSRNAGIALFVLLALDPWLFHPILTRVIREALYMSLGLALVALVMLLLFAPDKQLTWRRAALLAATGFLFAAYWLTREESVWLYPALVLVALAALARSYSAFSALRERWKTALAAFAPQAALVVAGFVALAGVVVALNHAHYGVFMTNEFREGAFPKAYGALQRIEPPVWSRYMMFDEAVAAEAYGQSASARELKPIFDGENGQMWRDIGCRALSLDPCPSAYARGWFMWALRDAALLAGHYKSEGEAQSYFVKLAGEIDAACDAGRIKCGAPRSVMAPPFDARYLAPWLTSFVGALAIVAHLDGVDVGAVASKGRPDQIAAFARMVGPVAPEAPLTLVGWAASRVCVPKVSVADEGGRAAGSARYETAQDVIAHFAKAGATVPATRFRIVTDCRGDRCRLVFAGCAPIAPQKLDGVVPGWLAGTGEVLVRIESKSNEASTAAVGGDTLGYALMWALAQLYRVLVPLLSIAGLAGTIVAAWKWRKLTEHAALAALTLTSLAAILARAAVIAAFDVTSAYAVNPLYLAPAAPFALVFGVSGAWLGLALFGERDRQ